MKVTTSRNPSQGARRLGKVIAGFLGVPYITRGKLSLDDAEGPWLVIVEKHGSPKGILKRSEGQEDLLAFAVDGTPVIGRLKNAPLIVADEGGEPERIAEFFEIPVLEGRERSMDGRSIEVFPDRIDLVDDGVLILRLKVKA